MLDLEAIVLRSGTVALAALAIIRVVLLDFNKLVNDFRRKRKHR